MKRFLIALLLTCGSTSVLAQGFSYTYLDLGYGEGDVEDIDGNGWGLGGSLSLAGGLHLTAGYSTTDLDDFGFEVNTTSLGLGYAISLSGSTDFIVSGSWVQSEADIGALGSFDEDGYGAGLGLRSWISDSLELNAGLDYVNLGGSADGDFSADAGLIYYFNESLGIGISGTWTNDPDSTLYAVNLRLNLGS